MSRGNNFSLKVIFSNPLTKGIIFLLMAALTFLLLFTWQYHIKDATEEFKKPKLLNLRIENEIYIRGMEWKEYQLVENSRVNLTCEIVRAPGMTVKFRLRYRDFDETKSGCDWFFNSGARTDETDTLTLDFLTGDGELIDSMSVKIKVVADAEMIEIYGLETVDGKALSGLNVPHAVRVYALARVRPFNTKNFTSLFFVENAFDGTAVLQLMPVDPEKPELKPVEGKITRYRRFGDKYDGYAFWTPYPILVGSDEDDRQVYNIYAGIFRTEDVPRILETCFEKLETVPDGGFRVKTRHFKIADLKRFSLNGNGITEPLRVIRGGYTTTAETLWKPEK